MRNKRMIFIGGLIAIVIVGSIGGYYAYQYFQEEPEPVELELKLINTVDLHYEEWSHTTNTGYAKFFKWKDNPERLALFDTTAGYKIIATLPFPEISIGKMQLNMRSDPNWYQFMQMQFLAGSEVVFSIWRDDGGRYFVAFGDTSYVTGISDTNWHLWYLEWDLTGDDKFLTVKIDETIHLENQKILTSADHIDKIIWRTTSKTVYSVTFLDLLNSYLESYVYE